VLPRNDGAREAIGSSLDFTMGAGEKMKLEATVRPGSGDVGADLKTTLMTDSARKSRILLVDDHPITRDGLKAVINAQLNLEVCAETDNAADALELVTRLRPDLTIVDIVLKTANGIELTKNLKVCAPQMPVLVVSMHDESLYAERAVSAGAMGYVMKQEAAEKVAIAIQHLLRGEIFLSSRMKEKILNRFVKKRSDHAGSLMETLSDREMEVFELIGDGYSTREIAQKLRLSVKTIDSYREHIKLKLGLESGSELVRHAIQWTASSGQIRPAGGQEAVIA
jgi:DNA-binding NarL/FixJ family response regulator